MPGELYKPEAIALIAPPGDLSKAWLKIPVVGEQGGEGNYQNLNFAHITNPRNGSTRLLSDLTYYPIGSS
ncbi:MAG TPA: hypothetical protein VHU91_02920, partial [Mycobacteriales bacterium]|nr:hypothetical protein [Mycobacteriales bacterium]